MKNKETAVTNEPTNTTTENKKDIYKMKSKNDNISNCDFI